MDQQSSFGIRSFMSTKPVPKPRLRKRKNTATTDLEKKRAREREAREYDIEVEDPKLWMKVSVSKPVDYIKRTLRRYEKELIAALLKNAPLSLLTLTENAHGSGLICGEVRRELKSLDPNVPHHLMCRYLLLHVHKDIHSQDKLIHWLELLLTVKVPSNVLSLVRQHYISISISGEGNAAGKRVAFEEFEVPALTEVLASHSSKWEVIAISLGLPDNKIKNIAAKNVSKPVEVALNEVLLSWVRGEFKHAKPPTMGSLQEALRSNTVGLGALAKEVKLFYTQSSLILHDISGKFGIADQTKHVDVTEGNYALLEVQISGNHEANYEWAYSEFGTHYGIHSNVNLDVLETYSDIFKTHSDLHDFNRSGDGILCILAGDISAEGYYKCEVTSTEGDKTQLFTDPILVTVHTPIDQYQSFLVDRYTRSPVIQCEWPPASTNSFINLALIKQESIHKAGKYGRCTIRGDMDDIFKDKESITYDKAFGSLSSGKYLLIEGRPGSGKTTLVHKFSQDWAKKEMTVSHVKLLFFIHLRGFCSDPNIGLSDLIGCYFSGSDVDVIEKYANKHQGLGLCFLLDGLDEYIPQKKSAYIYELIRKHVLPRSVVIVASRPAAAADFRKGASRQIEVLGFLRNQIYDYIGKNEFSTPTKSHAGLIKYLDEHPNVLHMCYLPIHTCMVCFLYDNLDTDLPQTETSIYAEFSKFTMLRMLYRDDSNSDMCIESLNDLPEHQNQLYVTICKLAFEMTSSSKQVMQQTEVKHFNLQPSDCMGLITVDKMAMMCGFQKLYTFLHLTFQEFLAAFYITSLDEEKQLELIEQFRDATQMKQAWKFYCGLVPLNGTNSTVIRLIDQSCHGTLFKVLCSFESQQPCTCDSVVDNNSLVFNNHFFTSSDFTAIAYVISRSNAQHQCIMKVVFDKCTIGMEGVKILAQKACGKLSLITTLCYHGYDCVTEQLSVVNRLMHSLPCLEILDVSNTNLGPAEVDALTVSLNHPNLQIVKVGSQGNPLYSSLDLPLILAERFSSGCSKLVNVCFSGNNSAYLQESLPFPFYLYCNFPFLNISFCKLRPIELQILSNDLMYTHELYLTGCGIDDSTMPILADGLKHCTNLEILDLSCNIIGDMGAASLASSVSCCLKLSRLNLSLNRIGDVGAMAVASVTKCLVYLCGNYITVSDYIIQHVSGHNADFHTLTLNYFSGCTDSGIESLLHFIQESSVIDSKALCELSTKTVQSFSSVRILDISSNNISCHGAITLSSCLKYFPHLEELNISSNNIETQGAIAIASSLSSHLLKLNIGNNSISSSGSWTEAIKHCVNLVELDISLNLISDKGAIALAEALRHHNKLCKLNISHNNIGSDGANSIADALNHCSHLEELIVSHNNFREDGACSIARSFCHYAQCLRKLDISYNNIGSEGCKAVAKALQQCVNIKELNVACNLVDDVDVIIALADLLKNCDLHRLDISHNKDGAALSHQIREDGASVLANTFSDNYAQCLHKLDISYTNIGSKGCKTTLHNLEELYVACNSMDGDDAIALAFTLKDCDLHKLDISFNNIGNDGANAIADVLNNCCHLKELIIGHNNFREIGASSIARSFCHYGQCLRKLDISYNDIGNDGAKAMAEGLHHCGQLEELIVSQNSLEMGVFSISRSFCYYAKCLRKLDISHNNIGNDGAKAISEALYHCSHLEELIISHNNFQEIGACSLAKSFCHYSQCLRKLDVSYNNIGNVGANAIADALNNCSHLEELIVSNNDFRENGVRSIARSVCYYAHCLRKLDISYNYIGSGAAKAIAESLNNCTRLEELMIGYNHLWEDGACALASTFSRYAKCIYKLDITSNCIKIGGCKELAKVLQHCVNLRILYMSYNLIGHGAIVFAEALKHCTNLFILDISLNDIGNDGADAIAGALKHCTLLEEVNVNRNNIGDNGACSLASSFSHYAKCLHKLYMKDNHIGSEGCKAIAEALQHCVNLEELDLSSNALKDSDVVVLARALSVHCTALRNVDISHNNIGSDGCSAIADLLRKS